MPGATTLRAALTRQGHMGLMAAIIHASTIPAPSESGLALRYGMAETTVTQASDLGRGRTRRLTPELLRR